MTSDRIQIVEIQQLGLVGNHDRQDTTLKSCPELGNQEAAKGKPKNNADGRRCVELLEESGNNVGIHDT